MPKSVLAGSSGPSSLILTVLMQLVVLYSIMVFSFLFRPLFWLVVFVLSATIETRAVTRC